MASGIFNSPIKAVLFDLDGTLVHSTLDFKKIRRDIACPDEYDVLAYLSSLDRIEREYAEQIVMQHELEDAHESQIIQGASSLLLRLEHQGIKTAIITRNSLAATQIKVQKSALNIEHILTREDAPAKPDPSALLHFSTLWGFTPHECVYVGDYLYDLQAANNAKMHACLYLHESESVIPHYAELADFICRDFDKFEQTLTHYLQLSSPANSR